MLTRVCAIAAIAGAFMASAAPALAGGGSPIVVDTDNHQGVVDTTVTSPGSPGLTGAGAAGGTAVNTGSGGAGPVTCTYTYPGDDSNLYRETQGGVDGRYYFQDCSDGSRAFLWFPDSARPLDGPKPAAVSPAVLARQAYGRLPLPVPAVHHSPDASGGRPQTVVGVQTWLWVQPATFTTLMQTVSAGAVWATVTARPVSTAWTTGSPDAPPMTCAGPGVAYNPQRDPAGQSTNCATVYGRSSAGQPRTGPSDNDRFFIGSATTTWQVSWVGAGGTRGRLPDLQRSSSFRLAVAELQAVNY